MSKDCLKCARYQQIKGWRVAREAYSLLWPILINNKSALHWSSAKIKYRAS